MSDRLSKYPSLDKLGRDLVSEAVDPASVHHRRSRGFLATIAIALVAVGGAGGVAFAQVSGIWDHGPPGEPPPIEEGMPVVGGQPGAYEEAMRRGLSIPVISAAGDGHGGYVYGPYNCDAHTRWFEVNIAPKWLNGEYADPREFPEPPANICSGEAAGDEGR